MTEVAVGLMPYEVVICEACGCAGVRQWWDNAWGPPLPPSRWCTKPLRTDVLKYLSYPVDPATMAALPCCECHDADGRQAIQRLCEHRDHIDITIWGGGPQRRVCGDCGADLRLREVSGGAGQAVRAVWEAV